VGRLVKADGTARCGGAPLEARRHVAQADGRRGAMTGCVGDGRWHGRGLVGGVAGDWVGPTWRSGIHNDMEGELCPGRMRTGEGGRQKETEGRERNSEGPVSN
jgi:hypothetical protein